MARHAPPPVRLRELLAAELDAGEDFERAWSRSISPALRYAPGRDLEDWREAFAATRAAWRRAYTAAAPEPIEEALAACA